MIVLHVALSLTAIAVGGLVLGTLKGTARHRRNGWIYAICLYTVSFSGFFIQETTGGLSIFHWFSVQAIILVSAGLAVPVALRSRFAEWPAWHLRFMAYSYITLILTGVAQFFDYLPFPSEALNAIVFLTLPSVLGVVGTESWGTRRWRSMLQSD